MLPQDTTYLIQRPCYQRASLCQDPAGNWTTWRSPDDRKETQTAVVWSCLPFIRSGQNHLARHSEREKKIRRTKEEVGRQHQGMYGPGDRQVPEGSGEQVKMEKTGCKIICSAPTTLAVKGMMMMVMMMMMMLILNLDRKRVLYSRHLKLCYITMSYKRQQNMQMPLNPSGTVSVSYTHLTLPTTWCV